VPEAFVPSPDACSITAHKPIISHLLDYRIQDNTLPCFNIFSTKAIPFGPPTDYDLLPEDAFAWTGLNLSTQMVTSGTGRIFDFWSLIQPFQPCDGIEVTLQVSACGQQITRTAVIDCTPCDDVANRTVVITPNPANDQISVHVMQNNGTQDFVTTDPNGVRLLMYPTSGGTTALMDTYLYTNGQVFSTVSIPNGMYTLIATASDLVPIQTNLAIIR